MNTQLNTHFVCETIAAPFVIQPVLPAILEQTARKVFDSFPERLKERLNGRQDRALKLALEGHVTHKSGRVYSVRSETGDHAYLVDLSKSYCNCPDTEQKDRHQKCGDQGNDHSHHQAFNRLLPENMGRWGDCN